MTGGRHNQAHLSATGNLLTDESKRTLTTYHKMQMNREQLVNPAESGRSSNSTTTIHSAIVPLLDVLDQVRLKWKHAEDRMHAAEERSERIEKYNM